MSTPADLILPGRATTKPDGFSRIRSYLETLDHSSKEIGLSSLGVAVVVLLAMAASTYAAAVVLAIVTGRHLYGDGSWFLIKMLSENHVAVWNVHGWHDLFVGRFGAFAYQEYPTLLASRLHVTNIKTLILIYGATLFCFKPLSILICYRFVRDKRLVIFPLLTLFAVTMNGEVYLVSETHLMTALFWPALFGLMYRRKFDAFDVVLMVVVSAPLLLCYETMVAYGLFLCGACVYRYQVVVEDRWEKWLSWILFSWYALGVLFAGLAIVLPRDAANRDGFLRSMLFIFRNDHIGARVSCIVLVLCALVVLIPERHRRILNSVVAVSVLVSLAIPAYIILRPQATNFGTHVIARTMNATGPLALLAAFLLLHFQLIRIGVFQYQRLFVMAAVLGICQSSWSMIASTQWSNMLTVLRAELRTHAGPVPFERTVLSQWIVDGQPIRALHADWPLITLSILYSENHAVRTILLPPPAAFHPFDPYSSAKLPDLRRFGFSYADYVAAKPPTRNYELGEWISFAEPWNAAMIKERGWWNAESWGTWSSDEAAILVNLPKSENSELLLQGMVGAFVNEKNPDIHVAVFANKQPIGEWEFHYKPGSEPYQKRELVIRKEALSQTRPLELLFHVSGVHSPSELGMGNDPRKLGFAVAQMRLIACKGTDCDVEPANSNARKATAN